MNTQAFLYLISLIIDGILIIGVFYFLIKKYKHPLGYYLLATLFLEISGELLHNVGISNLYLFSISYYLNFLYLSFYFFTYLFKINKKTYYAILIAGCIPMIIKLFFWGEIKKFEAYDWILYDTYLIIAALLAILKLIQRSTIDKNHLLICFSILAFFGLDFSTSFAMNYLVNGNPEIVLYIWQLRAIVLLGYFLTLTICTWKILKKA